MGWELSYRESLSLSLFMFSWLIFTHSMTQDLDYTFSPTGELPKYMPSLGFPPSYFHRVIRTGPTISNPIVHVDLSPWGEEIAANLQLLQDRVRTET